MNGETKGTPHQAFGSNHRFVIQPPDCASFLGTLDSERSVLGIDCCIPTLPRNSRQREVCLLDRLICPVILSLDRYRVEAHTRFNYFSFCFPQVFFLPGFFNPSALAVGFSPHVCLLLSAKNKHLQSLLSPYPFWT